MITVAMIIIVDRIDLTNMMYIACDLSVKCLCWLQHTKRFILYNVQIICSIIRVLFFTVHFILFFFMEKSLRVLFLCDIRTHANLHSDFPLHMRVCI